MFDQWTVHDYGALIGIILGIGTFWINRHTKRKWSRQGKARQGKARQGKADGVDKTKSACF
ncbi:TPA: HP1 family phage holin [Salmonella enterica]